MSCDWVYYDLVTKPRVMKMDNDKIKTAFRRVKEDIFILSSDLYRIKEELKREKKNVEVEPEVKRQIQEIKETDIKGFTQRVQQEFSSRDNQFSALYGKMTKISEDIQLIANSMQKNKLEITEMNKKFNAMQKWAEKTNSAVDLLSKEMKMVKMQSVEKSKIGESLSEFNMMMNEKISLEMNNLRFEFAEEIKKLYDTFSERDSKIVEEPQKEIKIPKKRGRKKKSEVESIAVNKIDEEIVKPTPKKRGRKKKSEVESVVVKEAYEEPIKPAPKKRGRKKKSEKEAIEKNIKKDEISEKVEEKLMQTENDESGDKKGGVLKKMFDWFFVDDEEDEWSAEIESSQTK